MVNQAAIAMQILLKQFLIFLGVRRLQRHCTRATELRLYGDRATFEPQYAVRNFSCNTDVAGRLFSQDNLVAGPQR